MKKLIRLLPGKICLGVVTALTVAGIPCTHAANRTWNGNVSGGNIHIWANNNNWNGVSYPQSSADTAIFTSVVGFSSTPKITVNGLTIGNLTYNVGAASFTIIRDTTARTLTVTGTITQNAANAQVIDVPLAGTAGLNKAGTGALVITATNTYTGTTTISAGKLLGKSGGIIDSAINVTSATATNAVQIATAAGQFRCNGLTFTAAGVMSFDFNNGIVPDAATAPLLVNGDLNFTATPSVIVLNNSIPSTTATYPLISYTNSTSGTPPTTVEISPALTGGATASLQLNTTTKTLNLVVTAAAGPPTKLVFTAVPSLGYVGVPFSVTVQAQDAGGIPRNPTNDTTITLSKASGSGSLSGTLTGIISSNANSVTISTPVYSADDILTLTATATAGMTTLTSDTSGNIQFTQPAQVLHWGPNDANWVDANVWYNPSSTSTATYNNLAPDIVVFEDTDSGVGDRTITLNTTVSPGGVTNTAAKNFTLTGSGAIGGSTGLSKSGAGTLTLGNANTFRGDTRVVAGTLLLTNNSALQNSTVDFSTLDSGTLSFDSLTAVTLGGLKGGRDLALTNASGAAATISVGNNTSNTTYLGVLSGSGGFTKTGSGTFTWGDGTTPSMTYSGSTLIDQGTAVITKTDLLPYGSGKGDVTVNGTLNTVDLNMNGLNGSGIVAMTTSAGATLIIGNNNASGSFSGTITRSGPTRNSVIKVGTGTQTLSGATAAGNAVGWGFFINAGKVIATVTSSAVGAYGCTVNDPTGVGSATLEINNLTLDTLNSQGLTLGTNATLTASGGTGSYSRSGGGPIIVTNANVTLSTATSGDTLNLGSAVTGGNADALITAAGPGLVVLGGGSGPGFGGKWKLTAGTLRLGDINSLGASGTKAIELAGGILEGRVAAAGAYSTATTVSANSTITPNQAAAGADHNYGTLSINGSTLAISPGSQITDGTTETATFGATTLSGNVIFDIANNGAKSMAAVLGAVGESGGTRSLTKQGTGSLKINGVSTYSGGTTISGGTLEIGVSSSIKSNVTITGSVLRLDNATAMEAAATLTLPANPGAGTVNLNFGGTQTIAALYFGVAQQAQGTWGAIGSGATHQRAAFTGTGLVNVTTGPNSSIGLTSSANPVAYGALVLTATVSGTGGPPTGTVTFKEGANVLSVVPLSAGVATLNPAGALPPGGPYSLTAEYSGDGTFSACTSLAVSQTVTNGNLIIQADNKSKTYGGTVALTFTALGLAPGETVGSATVTCSQAGDATAPAGSYTITASNATGGTFNPANYTISYQTGTLTVNPAGLTVTGIDADDKVYDGTTNATLVVSNAVLLGAVNGDVLSLETTNAVGGFTNKTVGVAKLVQVSGLQVYGSQVTNYALLQPTTNANITARTLTITGLTAQNKPYDGGTVATLTGTAGLSGAVGGDDVSLTGTAAGAFTDPNVGTGKTVNVSGLTLTGSDATNYTLTPLALSADITPASTATGLLSSQNPSAPGSNVTFTATVSSGAGTPGGDVVFKANTVPFSTNALVSGVAAASITTLPLGTNAVTAEYAAQGNYLGSTGSVDQVVESLVTCSATNVLLSIGSNLDGTFTLTFVGTPQADYYVVSSADVAAPMNGWAPILGSTNTVTNLSGVWQFIVTNAAPAQYYRGTAVTPCL